MMRFIRRRVRGVYFVQALLFLFLGVGGLVALANRPGEVPFKQCVILFALVFVGMVDGIAWWSTRKPSPYRNDWAIAASVMSLCNGGFMLWVNRAHLSPASPGVLTVILSVVGLAIFSQGGLPEHAKKAGVAEPAKVVAKPEKPRPVAGDRTSPWGSRAFTVLSYALQLGSVFLWGLWAHAHRLRQSGLPWYFSFTLTILVVTTLHECGHAAVALFFKMKLMSFHAGPVRWTKREGKWTFKLDWEGFFNLSGSVRVVPTDPAQPRHHDLWVDAAGPLANIVTGLGFLAIVLTVHWSRYDPTWRILAYIASFSFITAITNLVPFRIEGGGYSDGAHIVQILTKSPLYDYLRASNSVAALAVTEQRYRDLDVAALERGAAVFPQQLEGMRLQVCLAKCHHDAGRMDEARSALAAAEKIYDQHSIDLPGPLHTSMVVGHALLNRYRRATRLWFDRWEAKGVERKNVDYWLAKTAVLWVEGKKAEAEEAWQEASKQAEKLPHFGAYEFDRRRCEMLREALDGAAPVAGAETSSPVRRREEPRVRKAVTAAVVSGVLVADRIAEQVAERAGWDPVQILRAAAMQKAAR